MSEDALPILNVLPKSRKLVEADLSAAVDVEHAHEHLDGIQVKGSPVAVDECLTEFLRVDLATVVAVDGNEPLPKLRISSWRRTCR